MRTQRIELNWVGELFASCCWMRSPGSYSRCTTLPAGFASACRRTLLCHTCSTPQRGIQNAIEKGVAFAGADKPRQAVESDEIEAVALDQAMANVCGMLESSVLGRIAVEVDPRLSSDVGAS